MCVITLSRLFRVNTEPTLIIVISQLITIKRWFYRTRYSRCMFPDIASAWVNIPSAPTLVAIIIFDQQTSLASNSLRPCFVVRQRVLGRFSFQGYPIRWRKNLITFFVFQMSHNSGLSHWLELTCLSISK